MSVCSKLGKVFECRVHAALAVERVAGIDSLMVEDYL